MLEFVLDGLAAGLAYALIAAALALVRVAWSGLERPRHPAVPVENPGLRLPAVLLAASALVWLGRRVLAGVVVVLPAAPVLAWLLPPLLLAGVAWSWWASRLGAVWRAQAERPGAAFELGLPLRRASLAGLALAAGLSAAAVLPASGTVLMPVVAPEVKALAAALAAGGAAGRPIAAAALALLVGLAEGGAAAALAPADWAAGWAQGAGYAVLLPFLLLRAGAVRAGRGFDEGVGHG